MQEHLIECSTNQLIATVRSQLSSPKDEVLESRIENKNAMLNKTIQLTL